jgi:hypothetical protein
MGEMTGGVKGGMKMAKSLCLKGLEPSDGRDGQLSGNNPSLFINTPSLIFNNPALIFNNAALFALNLIIPLPGKDSFSGWE